MDGKDIGDFIVWVFFMVFAAVFSIWSVRKDKPKDKNNDANNEENRKTAENGDY